MQKGKNLNAVVSNTPSGLKVEIRARTRAGKVVVLEQTINAGENNPGELKKYLRETAPTLLANFDVEFVDGLDKEGKRKIVKPSGMPKSVFP